MDSTRPQNKKSKTGFEIGKRLGREAFEESIDFLAELDESLADCFIDFAFGEVMSRDILPIKERQLCIISSLVVLGEHSQLDWHIKAGINLEISIHEILETIIHCIPFSGWPKGINALRTFKNSLSCHGMLEDFLKSQAQKSHTDTDFEDVELMKKGRYHGSLIYSDYAALESTVASYDKDLPRLITEGIFGRFYGRPGLNIRIRQLTAVAILTSLQRLPQLRSHIKGAHLVGCSEEETKELIILMHMYCGWPATLNALSVWHEIKMSSLN